MVWKSLLRYENKRQQVDMQIAIVLMNLPKVPNETSEEFIDLFSIITNFLSELETLCPPTDS